MWTAPYRNFSGPAGTRQIMHGQRKKMVNWVSQQDWRLIWTRANDRSRCPGFCSCSWRNYLRSLKSTFLYWRSVLPFCQPFAAQLASPDKWLFAVNLRVASAEDFSSGCAVLKVSLLHTQLKTHIPYKFGARLLLLLRNYDFKILHNKRQVSSK